MLLVSHISACSTKQKRDTVVQLLDIDEEIKTLHVPTRISNIVLRGSKYENIEPLLKSSTCLVRCQHKHLAKVLKIIESNQQMLLMGGVFEGIPMSVKVLKDFTSLPSKEQLLANLLYTLNTPIQHFVQNLEMNQRLLLHTLNTYSQTEN